MLYDVLTQVAADIGFEPVQQRASLIALLNRASKELYNMLECNKILRETTLVVQRDSRVALPSFIGELRGMRMHTNELPFDLHSISTPRYVSNTLSFKYKNWRDLGDSPVCGLPATFGKLYFYSDVVEGAVVKVVGTTNVAARLEEEVTLIAATSSVLYNGSTINLFGPNLISISSFSPRTADITVRDAEGNIVAILYNCDNKTRYKLIDVSQLFWSIDTNEGDSFIDVCYKVPFTRLTNDADSFQAGDDYDNAWYFMAMHMHLKTLQGREEESKIMYQSAIAACKSAKDGSEQQIMKKISFGRNKFYNLFKRCRYVPGSVTNVDTNV